MQNTLKNWGKGLKNKDKVVVMSCIPLHSTAFHHQNMNNSRIKWANVKPSQVVHCTYPQCISTCLLWVIYYTEIQILSLSRGDSSNIRKNITTDTCSRTWLKSHQHLKCILKPLQVWLLKNVHMQITVTNSLP